MNLLNSSLSTSSVRLTVGLDGPAGGNGVFFFGSSTGVSAGMCVSLAGVGGGGIKYRLYQTNVKHGLFCSV